MSIITPQTNFGETFYIDKLIFTPMTKQPALYSRPYTLHTDASIPNILMDRIDASGGGELGGSMVNDIAANIIRPSTVAYDTVANTAWMNTPRYNFMMRVVSMSPITGNECSYIQGYTDFDGVNIGYANHATAAPEMKMFVTNVIETVVTETATPLGIKRVEKLRRVYDVVKDETIEGVCLLRPDDIIDRINAIDAHQKTSGPDSMWNDILNNDGGYVDIYGETMTPPDMNFNSPSIIMAGGVNRRFTEHADVVNVDYNLSTSYFADTITQGIKQRVGDKYMRDDFDIQFDTTTSTHIMKERELSRNRFLSYISGKIGDIAVKGVFTYGDLYDMDPRGADNFYLTQYQSDNMHSIYSNTPGGDSVDEWYHQDPATVTAHSMLQSAISIASGKGFTYLLAEFSNQHSPIIGDNVMILDAHSYMSESLEGRSMALLLNMVKTSLQNDMFIVESRGGALMLSGKIYIDMMGDSKIYLEYNGMPGVWKSLPTTANRHVMPTVGTDTGLVDTTAGTFGVLIDEISRGFN